VASLFVETQEHSMATAEQMKEQRRLLQAQMDELQRQEDEAAAAALTAQGQPLEDAIQRATTAEALVVQLQDSVVQLQDSVVQLQASSEQLATENRALERKNIELRGKVEDLTTGISGAVQTVLDGVAQSADALKQASNNMAILESNAKGFSRQLQSILDKVNRGVVTNQDTSTARTSGTLR
jgi:predicted RNase H-like nuclease (RuvC/YqgF family)